MKRWFFIILLVLLIGGCMSDTVVVTPDPGDDWATAWTQVEYARKGKMGLSVTNYDNTSLPAIADGSWCEVGGAIYPWTSEEAISGSLSSNAINYVKLVPGGSGASAYVTATWTTTEPTWSDSLQGWYDGTSRYVLAEYYDGTNHLMKTVLYNRHCGFLDRIYTPSCYRYTIPNATIDGYGIDIPEGIITAFACYVHSGSSFGTGGYCHIDRLEMNTSTSVTCASVGTTEGETTTIPYPVIAQKDLYSWRWLIYNNSGSIQTITTYIKIKQWCRG